MAKRIILGVLGLVAIVAAFWTARADAADFARPNCSAYAGVPESEGKCFRKAKEEVRFANYAALQKTGLEFAYLARPPADLGKYPEAKAAAEAKTEGEFLITFSVNTDGSAYDVKVVSASSAPIAALARVWVDTIAEWKFVKVAKPVTGVPFRRIYLYSKDDDDRRGKKSGG